MGMIFACNYPLTEQYFTKATKMGGRPLMITAVIVGSIALWWILEIYSLVSMVNQGKPVSIQE